MWALVQSFWSSVVRNASSLPVPDFTKDDWSEPLVMTASYCILVASILTWGGKLSRKLSALIPSRRISRLAEEILDALDVVLDHTDTWVKAPGDLVVYVRGNHCLCEGQRCVVTQGRSGTKNVCKHLSRHEVKEIQRKAKVAREKAMRAERLKENREILAHLRRGK